jgi:nitrogen fixation protein NifU and related proteins
MDERSYVISDRVLQELRSSYSETVVEHLVHPRNNDPLPNADGFAEVQSGCGEIIKIWLRVRNDRIEDAAYWTNGCAATIASGSMAAELIKGRSVKEAQAVVARDISDALGLPKGNFHSAELVVGAMRAALQDLARLQHQPWRKLYRR